MRFERLGFAGAPADYFDCWDRQRQLHSDVATGSPPTTMLVQHAPVYTAGKRTAPWDRPESSTPVVDVDRGGRITWHGPGQVVGYPVMKLPEPVDVVAYVRTLESMLIDVCHHWGVDATRVDGRSGVWIPRTDEPWAKIAAIGVRVAKGITMHGFALNVDCDLRWFDRIVPCGLNDVAVTTLEIERQQSVDLMQVSRTVEQQILNTFEPLLD